MRSLYVRNGVSCFIDRSRGFLVQATPEEEVRQDTIDWLIDELGIPSKLVRAEFNTTRRGGTGRADILVLGAGSNDYEGKTILIVECKRPGAFLDDRTLDQATGYAETVGAAYVLLTNGEQRVAYASEKGRWRKLAQVPSWREMLKQRKLRWAIEPVHTRTPWSSIDTAAKCKALVTPGSPYEFILGEDSPDYLAPFVFNLFGCLTFEHQLALPLEDDAIVIQEDLGLRARWFGNSAGGRWPSEYYRSLLVREKRTGSHQVVSRMILAGAKQVNDPVFGNRAGKTYLCVAVDEGARSHLSLELALDQFISEGQLKQKRVVLRHNGRMSAGTRGSTATDTVLKFIRDTAPYLIDDRQVLLGALPSTRLINWNDAEDFLVRIVRYALVRDALRSEQRAKASPTAPCPWKHGDLVKALYEGKPHEPARIIRIQGRTRAFVHWYDDTFSSIRIRDILGTSAKRWRLDLVAEDEDVGPLDVVSSN